MAECDCYALVQRRTSVGNPYMDRTKDVNHCPMHAAAGDMRKAVVKFLAVVDESEGITGWHLSGADALWSDFDFIEDLREAAARGGAA